ncbi:MAG: hypothetical protein AB7E76_12715 [Deferribacterales bacterium]
MAQRWCKDCDKMVDVTKKNYYAAIVLTLSAMFFTIVPFFGTVIGVPAIILSTVWLIFTKNVCAECGGSKLIKRDPPTEAEIIMRKFEEKSKEKGSNPPL